MPQLKVKKGTKAPDGDGTHYNPREDPCVPGKVGTGTREALRGHILAKNVPKRDKVHGPNPRLPSTWGFETLQLLDELYHLGVCPQGSP